MAFFERFLADEAGAVSMDFVVLTASITTLGLVVGTGIVVGTEGLNNKSVAVLDNIDPEDPSSPAQPQHQVLRL